MTTNLVFLQNQQGKIFGFKGGASSKTLFKTPNLCGRLIPIYIIKGIKNWIKTLVRCRHSGDWFLLYLHIVLKTAFAASPLSCPSVYSPHLCEGGLGECGVTACWLLVHTQLWADRQVTECFPGLEVLQFEYLSPNSCHELVELK